MSRHFADISKEDFMKKFKTILDAEEDEEMEDYDIYGFKFTGTILKDISKVSFDFENYDYTDGAGFMNYPCGYYELSNSMKCIMVNAGGDWEEPICFCIYWDGQQLRGYIPKAGNVWNRVSKTAFGSEDDEQSEFKGVRQFLKEAKSWVSDELKKEIDEALESDKNYYHSDFKLYDTSNKDAIFADVMKRIVKK